MAFFDRLLKPSALPTRETALPGRPTPIPTAERHFVSGHRLDEVPAGHAVATFALGCFWGAERLFWQTPGVYVTSVGYKGGFTENATYEEVCSGGTGHAEVVEVVFDPRQHPRDFTKISLCRNKITHVLLLINDLCVLCVLCG